MTFEVQTYTLCDGWVNTWSDDNEDPITFATLEQAQGALRDYLEDIQSEVVAGNLESYDPASFRVHSLAT